MTICSPKRKSASRVGYPPTPSPRHVPTKATNGSNSGCTPRDYRSPQHTIVTHVTQEAPGRREFASAVTNVCRREQVGDEGNDVSLIRDHVEPRHHCHPPA